MAPSNVRNKLRSAGKNRIFNPFIIISLYYFKEVHSHDFKDHTEVVSIRSFVNKRVQQLHDMAIISGELGPSFLNSDEAT